MALVMEFIKVPRYHNILTNVYETVPIGDLALIDKYFFWTMLRAEGKTDACTMEEWCGISESRLPHKYVVNFYGDYFTEKRFYNEHWGETEVFSIFTPQARIVKANQIFRWFIEHVMNGKIDKEHHEVAKTQLAELLFVCRRVRKSFMLTGHNEIIGDTFSVNEAIAKHYLPLMEQQGFFFGTDQYDSVYAANIIDTIHAVKHILDTTDFKTETVYFNASW